MMLRSSSHIFDNRMVIDYSIYPPIENQQDLELDWWNQGNWFEPTYDNRERICHSCTIKEK
jgi:hypothetical protein